MPELFDLSANHYSRDAQGYWLAFKKYYPQGKDIPGIARDGDFTKAYATGMLLPQHPFAEVGDPNTAVVRQRYMQMASYYAPMALGTNHPDDGRLLLINETDFNDEGQGIVSWDRVYATIPAAHDEWGSFSYGFQYLTSVRPFKLGEQPITVTSRVHCEYFHVRELNDFGPIQQQRFIALTDYYISLRGGGDWHIEDVFFTTTQNEIPAEDSDIGYWHFPIMYRRTRYVPGPTRADWGTEFALPSV